MRVVFTVNTYYPMKDGVQAVTGYLAENLIKRGHQVNVVTPVYGDASEEEEYNGVHINRLPIVTRHAMYYGDKDRYQKLILALTSQADVLVNVCTQTPTTDWVFPILDKIHCKKILYVHGMVDRKWHSWDFANASHLAHKVWNQLRWGVYYRTIGSYVKKYNHVVQLHDFDDANLFFKKRYGIDGFVIGNAADPEFFDESKDRNEKDRYAIYVANYMERKNQKKALEAFYKACVPDDFGLILIGSENNQYYREVVELNIALSKRYGEKKVRLLYGIPRSETVNWVKNAYLYLMSSKWEAFPVSIVESMAAGVPFISTDVGCVKYLPGGVVANEVEAMTYWIETFTGNNMLRTFTGACGRTYAKQKLTINGCVSQLEALMDNKK